MDIKAIQEQLQNLYSIVAIDKTATTQEAREFQKEFLKIIQEALDNTSEETVSKAMAMSGIYTKAQQNLALAKDIAAIDKTFAAEQMKEVTGEVIKQSVESLKDNNDLQQNTTVGDNQQQAADQQILQDQAEIDKVKEQLAKIK